MVSSAISRAAAIGVAWGLGVQLLLDTVGGTGLDGSRHLWFAGVSVVALAAALMTRQLASRRLRSLRREGLAVRRALAVGPGAQITALIDRFASDTEHPFVVVGACVEGDHGLVDDVPEVARLSGTALHTSVVDDADRIGRVLAAARELNVDMVCVAPGSGFTGPRLQALTWALNDTGVGLACELGTIDVAPHRVRVRRAGASTVLHVVPAPLRGLRRTAKAALDRIAASLLVVTLSPVMLAVAAAVKFTSKGPVVYRQTRIGQGGRRFTMLKFRSMYTDADERRAELVESVSADGPMFKMYDDPRITRVGRVLRKYSLDELLQLFNVIRGEMSLVGPRPPLPDEVATYDDVAMRRLLVTPGLTGLWQVSGRSNLTWDETVRLDLRYVDNWTIATDLRLLGRTAGAVMRGTGAY